MEGNGHSLSGKTALIFGAAGAIGSTVAKVFAREKANLFLSGRSLASLKRLTDDVRKSWSQIESHEVDATKEIEVNEYVESIYKRTGKIDIVFNAIGSRMEGKDHVKPSIDVSLDLFMSYMKNMVLSQFLTARVAARHMIKQHRGVIVLMAATPARGIAPFIAGPSAAHAAIEGLTRCLATEWGPHGIRVVAVCSGGMKESPNIQEVMSGMSREFGVPREVIIQQSNQKTPLKRTPLLAETAEVLAYVASDRASSITGAIINASCGEVMD